ncbi:MAG TPA: sigma-E processing peptidase SpoIIGA [Clostridiales bacterium]|nr:sigma-E processing peptidase SpoIIGA [Clostridiales bacterium]
MYLEVYPDIIFIINFFMDLFLLYLLKIINKKNSSLIKLILASVIGGLSAALLGIFPWLNVILRFLLMNIVTAVIMIRIAFGKLSFSDMLKQILVFYMITYFIGGLINSIYYYTDLKIIITNLGKGHNLSNASLKTIILSILIMLPFILLLIWFYSWYKSSSREIYDVDLKLLDRSIHIKGFMDSGNCLYDPINKKPVIVVEEETIKELISPEFYLYLEDAKSYLKGEKTDIMQWDISVPSAQIMQVGMKGMDINKEGALKIKFIPYSSVGKKGVLLGMNIDKVMIYTGKDVICNEKVIAAISDNLISPSNEYQAILHKGLM